MCIILGEGQARQRTGEAFAMLVLRTYVRTYIPVSVSKSKVGVGV